MKTRKLYYTYSDNLGLLVVVTKVRGEGLLKSYGGQHPTKLDDLLKDCGFETLHPDDYLQVSTNEKDSLSALAIVNKYYNCSERVKMPNEDFLNFLLR